VVLAADALSGTSAASGLFADHTLLPELLPELTDAGVDDSVSDPSD